MEVVQNILHWFSFSIGVFIILFIIAVLVIRCLQIRLVNKKKCKHTGVKYGVVLERACTVEQVIVVCDQCGSVINRIVET